MAAKAPGPQTNIASSSAQSGIGRAQDLQDKLEQIIEEAMDANESRTPTDLRDSEDEGSDNSSGHVNFNLASSSTQDHSWVAHEVAGVRSVFTDHVDLRAYNKYVGKGKQVWMLEGVSKGEHVASFPIELKFSVYLVIMKSMHIHPPFTRFQQQVLRLLNVAPSQLHPNGWAFIRAFELVMKHLDRVISGTLFFHLFEVNRRHEVGSDGRRRYGHVSLRSKRKLKIFRLYSDSLKENWKKHYFFVSPVSSDAVEYVGKYNADGDLVSTKFPIGWSKAHFNRPPNAYHLTEKVLDAEDKETLRILKNCAQLIGEPHFSFDTQALVHARDKTEVQEALGEDLASPDFNTFLNEHLTRSSNLFSDITFCLLFQIIWLGLCLLLG